MIDSRADLIEDAYPFEDRHDAQRRAWGEPEIERDLTEHAPANTLWFGQPGARELRAMQVHGSPTETPTKGRSRQAASSSDGAAKSSPAARRRAPGSTARGATSRRLSAGSNPPTPGAAVPPSQPPRGAEPDEEAA